MKKAAFLLFSFPLLLWAAPPEQLDGLDSLWNEQKVDSCMQLQFPGNPERDADNTGHTLLLNVDTAVWLAKQLLPDFASTSAIFSLSDLHQYYDDVSRGMLEQTGAELIESKDSTLENKGYHARFLKMRFRYDKSPTGFGFQLMNKAKPSMEDIREVCLLVLDGSIYIFQYWYIAPQSEHKSQVGQKFFTSIRACGEAGRSRQIQDAKAEKIDSSPIWKNEWLILGVLFVVILLGYRLAQKLKN